MFDYKCCLFTHNLPLSEGMTPLHVIVSEAKICVDGQVCRYSLPPSHSKNLKTSGKMYRPSSLPVQRFSGARR